MTLSSAVLFALAFAITTTVHEIGHALAAKALGGSPILHDTFVEAHGLSVPRVVIVAAAGPLVNLLQGLLFWRALGWLQTPSATTRLFVLWLGAHGLMNFFGYLVSTPFATKGDLLSLAPSVELLATATGRSEHVWRIGILAWLLALIVMIPANMPPHNVLGVVYRVMSGMFTVVAYRRAADVTDVTAVVGDWSRPRLWLWSGVLLTVMLVNRLVLAPGVRLGKG